MMILFVRRNAGRKLEAAEVDTSLYKDAVFDSPLKVAGDVADCRNKLLPDGVGRHHD